VFNAVYAPLWWLCEQDERSEEAINWYVRLCEGEVHWYSDPDSDSDSD
jgi:hypothetical protein